MSVKAARLPFTWEDAVESAGSNVDALHGKKRIKPRVHS